MTENLTLSPSVDRLPDLFVCVPEVVADVIVDLRYAGAANFVGAPVDGYDAAKALLTRPAAEAVARVAADVARDGLVLKLYDCYRPARAVAHFARWAADGADLATKADYYPDHDKPDLFTLGYIAGRSSHSRGSTLDLTLAHRSDGTELDMGTPFDLFSARSWPESNAVSEAQKANRLRLAAAMSEAGFEPFFMEWWHFTLKGEPFSDTYFDVPIR
ncbi:M15 family metallopeptidase [Azorhizobium doebereinerae]|uniref:M15 family metallopeptidase n=1 Tax=Azorhizobium doebereinerae TaxID=281091 RepID=UPI000428B26D|nr:M15 family metallopeptidase [Azorhizobium doebereinerae]